MTILGIVGAGGFGHEVMAMLMQNPIYETYKLIFVVDKEYLSSTKTKYQVMSTEDFIALNCEKFYCLAIADSKIREKYDQLFALKHILPLSVFAHNCYIGLDNKIDKGAVFTPFSMVTTNTIVGSFFQCNIYSYVGHDCVIGDYVTFAPRVSCNGNVHISKHAYIGTGAILRNGSSSKPLIIGEGAIVGMGAVVTKDVAPFTTVVGNPAKIMQKN